MGAAAAFSGDLSVDQQPGAGRTGAGIFIAAVAWNVVIRSRSADERRCIPAATE